MHRSLSPVVPPVSGLSSKRFSSVWPSPALSLPNNMDAHTHLVIITIKDTIWQVLHNKLIVHVPLCSVSQH